MTMGGRRMGMGRQLLCAILLFLFLFLRLFGILSTFLTPTDSRLSRRTTISQILRRRSGTGGFSDFSCSRQSAVKASPECRN